MKLENKTKQKTLIIGHTVFSKNFMTETQQEFRADVIQTISKKKWKFYLTESWLQILPQIQQTQCQYFRTTWPYDEKYSLQKAPPLLKMIQQINFTNLLELSITSCKITNIEPIAFINMQAIQKINLSENFIVSLKPMNKFNWLKLKDFNLSSNEINEVDLSRMKMARQIQNFRCQIKNDSVPIDNVNIMVKLESKRISYFWVARNHRAILKQPLLLKLTSRFRKITFH